MVLWREYAPREHPRGEHAPHVPRRIYAQRLYASIKNAPRDYVPPEIINLLKEFIKQQQQKYIRAKIFKSYKTVYQEA